MMEDRYLTLSAPSEGNFSDRGSRFLAFAFPATTEEECFDQLKTLKKLHHGARHHCFAYRLNPEQELSRYSDDGEPGGTAGRPIYEQILSRNLFNVHVVVVRYFGGVLLGTGGLHQAYKKAAADALEQARIMEASITRDIEITFPYESMNLVMQWVDRAHPQVVNKEFTNHGKIIVRTEKSRVDSILEKFKQYDSIHTQVVST